ncbi:MAG: ribosome maturation factor RimM, partial [Desulfovibrio sp.]|nr:ribosome maturation factor RimM [Desulfovibrio sp.]
GCAILLEDGRRLGTLDHVEFPAGQPLWSIHTDDDREILFPAQPRFIAAFDTDAPSITIAPPEGLLDIYLKD